jgi:DNA-binding IclR family transcriptional regulator
MPASDKVLELLRGAGSSGVPVDEIPAAVSLTKPTVMKALKGLEADGLVRRNGGGVVKPVLRRNRRLIETEERDKRILAAVASFGPKGASLARVSEKAGTDPKLTYQSIWRLHASEQVTRLGATRTTRWAAA